MSLFFMFSGGEGTPEPEITFRRNTTGFRVGSRTPFCRHNPKIVKPADNLTNYKDEWLKDIDNGIKYKG